MTTHTGECCREPKCSAYEWEPQASGGHVLRRGSKWDELAASERIGPSYVSVDVVRVAALAIEDTRKTPARIDCLEREVEGIKAQIAQMQQARPVIVPIQSLEPASVEVTKPILAVVQEEDGIFLASFVDANVNASGDSQLDAIEMLKDLIASSFRLFVGKEPVLGDEPKRQLAVLRQFLRMR